MKDVHTAHCCAKCGCKYGKDDECTVAAGKAPAQYGCEFCEEELDYIKQNIPEGYALVPTELTDAMRDAWDAAPCLEDIDEEMRVAYRAMIAAAMETK